MLRVWMCLLCHRLTVWPESKIRSDDISSIWREANGLKNKMKKLFPWCLKSTNVYSTFYYYFFYIPNSSILLFFFFKFIGCVTLLNYVIIRSFPLYLLLYSFFFNYYFRCAKRNNKFTNERTLRALFCTFFPCFPCWFICVIFRPFSPSFCIFYYYFDSRRWPVT